MNGRRIFLKNSQLHFTNSIFENQSDQTNATATKRFFLSIRTFNASRLFALKESKNFKEMIAGCESQQTVPCRSTVSQEAMDIQESLESCDEGSSERYPGHGLLYDPHMV